MASSRPFANLVRLCFAVTVASAPFACSSEGGNRGPDGGSGGATDGTGGQVIDIGSGGGTDFDPITAPPTPNCGDGVRDEDEACDDGNQESGDGCGGNCRYIEPGYICPTPGEACRRFARCGDGVVVPPEQCDDGNTTAGDGCSPTCKFEIGYKCSGSPSECEPTVCGDNIIEGAETCDDGNTIPFDGCSEICQAEPNCTASGCTSRCGDGLVLGDEECDDGNTLDGDGCSSDCEIEDGYTCEQGNPCEDVAGECALRLPIVYRDFNASHSDFGLENGGPQGQGRDDCDDHVTGIPQNQLNSAGKPVFNAASTNACIASAASYSQWFGASTGTYATIVDSIVLFPHGSGAYVNRLNNAGDRYGIPKPSPGTHWCADDVSAGCGACRPGYDTCHAPCTPWNNNQVCATYSGTDLAYVDGSPLFFPIDNHPDALSDTRHVAAISQPVYWGNWQADPSNTPRNFHFTSEITYWFQYTSGSAAELTFVGDDDVWVFVNRRLAVDLGGVHVPLEGSFEIAANGNISRVNNGVALAPSNVTNFGMSDGGVYEIKVFHAERKRDGSSFKLTLSGFNTSRSECTSKCGDGIIAAGEECDDGVENNTGGYNRCNPDCTLSGYCGDGIRQENEECDDADPAAPASCKGCRLIIIR